MISPEGHVINPANWQTIQLAKDVSPATNRRRVNIVQACAIAGVSRRTIYNWMTDRKVEFVRTAGGSPRIFADTLFVKQAARLRR